MQVQNSERKRGAADVKPVSAAVSLKRAELASGKGRAVHGPTNSLADAKAAKPGDGKRDDRWRTGPNGGEDQTFNGVEGDGRGSDGPAVVWKASRKNTRGSWAAGEKRSAPLTTRVQNALSTPEARALRQK